MHRIEICVWKDVNQGKHLHVGFSNLFIGCRKREMGHENEQEALHLNDGEPQSNTRLYPTSIIHVP